MFFKFRINIVIFTGLRFYIHVNTLVPNPLLPILWNSNQMSESCLIREIKIIVKFFLFVLFLLQLLHFFINHLIDIRVRNVVCFWITSLKLFELFWNIEFRFILFLLFLGFKVFVVLWTFYFLEFLRFLVDRYYLWFVGVWSHWLIFVNFRIDIRQSLLYLFFQWF